MKSNRTNDAAKRRFIALLLSRPIDRASCRKKAKALMLSMEMDSAELLDKLETHVRWDYVSHLLIGRRKQLDLTIVAVAKQLKVAAYKIIAAEKGRIDDRIYPVLLRYAAHMGIETKYRSWEEKNQDLITALLPRSRQRQSNVIKFPGL